MFNSEDHMPGYSPVFLKNLREKREQADPRRTPKGRMNEIKRLRADAGKAIIKIAKEALAEAVQQNVDAAWVMASARAQAERILEEANQRAEEHLRNAGLLAYGDKPAPQAVIAEVSAMHGVPVEVILGKSRYPHITAARWEAIAKVYIARPDMTTTQIGLVFHLDHSSVINAVKKLGVWRGDVSRPHQDRKP